MCIRTRTTTVVSIYMLHIACNGKYVQKFNLSTQGHTTKVDFNSLINKPDYYRDKYSHYNIHER